MNRCIGCVLLMACFFGMYLSADQAIRISARPTVIAAQGSALLKVIVERNAMNRTLIWEIDGPAYYRSSSVQLPGSSAARSYFFMLRDLPGGYFDVRARVVRADSTEAVDHTRIVVGGRDGLDE